MKATASLHPASKAVGSHLVAPAQSACDRHEQGSRGLDDQFRGISGSKYGWGGPAHVEHR
jgi:hypothetical protein